MQTQNRLLDDLARVASGAMGVASSMRGEVEARIRSQLDRLLDDMDLVTREEFDAVKAMAAAAREEQERLSARVAELEARLEALAGAPKSGSAPKSSGAKTASKAAPRRKKTATESKSAPGGEAESK